MNTFRPGLMPLYRSRERGRQETIREVGQLHEQFIRRRIQEEQRVSQSEFERLEIEKQIADQALQQGSLIPFLEFRQEQARARLEAQVALLKERYTHAKLEAELKKAFTREQAKNHAQKIQAAIMAHPETLKLLQRGVDIRREQNRLVIGDKEAQWLIWAAQHRQQLRDKIINPQNTRRNGPAARVPHTTAHWNTIRLSQQRKQRNAA